MSLIFPLSQRAYGGLHMQQGGECSISAQIGDLGNKSVVLQVSPSKINFRMKITFMLDSVGLHSYCPITQGKKGGG